MTDLSIVRYGVDTLVCAFDGILDASLMDELDELKAKAQRLEKPQPFSVDGADLCVMEKGGGKYRVRLQGEGLTVRVTDSTSLNSVLITMGARGLAEQGHERQYELARVVASGLGATYPVHVSRIDLAVDIQGWKPSETEMEGVCCPSPERSHYLSAYGGETFSYGKKPLMIRFYNKSAQIRSKKGNGWWHQVWALNPDYDPNQDVWRLEVELWRERLKRLPHGSRHKDVLENLGDTWAHGLESIELRIPSETDQTKTRWPEHPYWTFLRTLWGTREPPSLFSLRNNPMTHERNIVLIRNGLVRFAATYGIEDFHQAMELLYNELQLHCDSTDFDLKRAILDERVRRDVAF